MAIVDVHTHIYPGKISEKATRAVGNFYELEMFGEKPGIGEAAGTVEQLLEVTSDSPITHHVVHSVATKPEQVQSINNFIISECALHTQLIGFASMHQDYENPEDELLRIKAAGLRGVKIHPDIQHVNLDDDRLMKVYEACEQLELPLILHMGDYRYDYSHPRRLVNVLRSFPKLVVDAAHMGGWSIFEIALDYLKNEQCFVDISSTFIFSGVRRARELVQAYGADRVLFGSDYPMESPVHEYELFMQLGLSDSDNEKILWHNAEHFLGMKI